jgi:ketosteroid isomerase-like protein
VDGKAAAQQAMQTLFATTERVTLTLPNPQFRVMGTTGLVWSHTALMIKPTYGPLTSLVVYSTWTFVKTEGRWLVVAIHQSRLSSGTEGRPAHGIV